MKWDTLPLIGIEKKKIEEDKILISSIIAFL